MAITVTYLPWIEVIGPKSGYRVRPKKTPITPAVPHDEMQPVIHEIEPKFADPHPPQSQRTQNLDDSIDYRVLRQLQTAQLTVNPRLAHVPPPPTAHQRSACPPPAEVRWGTHPLFSGLFSGMGRRNDDEF